MKRSSAEKLFGRATAPPERATPPPERAPAGEPPQQEISEGPVGEPSQVDGGGGSDTGTVVEHSSSEDSEGSDREEGEDSFRGSPLPLAGQPTPGAGGAERRASADYSFKDSSGFSRADAVAVVRRGSVMQRAQAFSQSVGPSITGVFAALSTESFELRCTASASRHL